MATEKQGLIYAKIAAVMSEVGHIGKKRENQQQRYQFRGIDDVYNTLHEPLAKNGVFYTSTVLTHNAGPVPTKSGGQMIHVTLTVRYTFYCEDGSSITTEARGEAMDSGDKAEGKAQSYALKVALMQLFCIPTEEQKDTEYQTHELAQVTLPQAIGEVFLAETNDEVDTLWAAYPSFQEIEGFHKIVAGRKKQLTKALS